MAAALLAGRIPVMFNHDYSRPLSAAVLDAGVETLDDGERAVWVEFEIPDNEWAQVEESFKLAGVAGGMSFSAAEHTGSENSSAILTVAADAHHFTDDEIVAAVAEVPEGTANTERLFQFALIPEAAIVVHFALNTQAQVPANLLAEMIIAPVRRLWRRDRPGQITIRATRDGQWAETVVSIQPTSQRDLDTAMRELPAALHALAELQRAQSDLPVKSDQN